MNAKGSVFKYPENVVRAVSGEKIGTLVSNEER
jgi:hypothetical protein